MSDILHDTLHVWHIDLSYSYKRQTTKTHGKNYAITMQKNAKSRAILRGFHIFSYIFVHISGIFQYSAFAIFRLLCLFVLRLPHTLRLRHGFQAFVTTRFDAVFECFFSPPRF